MSNSIYLDQESTTCIKTHQDYIESIRSLIVSQINPAKARIYILQNPLQRSPDNLKRFSLSTDNPKEIEKALPILYKLISGGEKVYVLFPGKPQALYRMSVGGLKK